ERTGTNGTGGGSVARDYGGGHYGGGVHAGARDGHVAVRVTGPEGPQLGTVAVPGGEQVFNMKEPVAIVCPNDDLNIQMPNDERARDLWRTTTRLTGADEWLTCGARGLSAADTGNHQDSGLGTLDLSGRQQTPDGEVTVPWFTNQDTSSSKTSRHHSPPTCLHELPIETNNHTHRPERTSSQR
ncbi:unnamed protein product, partial [Ectocarpus sp. 6 AP-2014]